MSGGCPGAGAAQGEASGGSRGPGKKYGSLLKALKGIKGVGIR